jgi:hypothetical protein
VTVQIAVNIFLISRTSADDFREQIEQQLAQKLQTREQAVTSAGLQVQHATEVSPWLEMTKWGRVLSRQELTGRRTLDRFTGAAKGDCPC